MTTIVTRQIDSAALQTLISQNVDPVMARLYAARGVLSDQDLDTRMSALLAPALLAHIDAAAQFLSIAIQAKQKLLIIAESARMPTAHAVAPSAS